MEDTVNPQGNESPAPINIEAAFDDYLKRQANPASDEGSVEQPAQGADTGQPDSDAKPDAPEDAPAEEQRFKVKVNGEEKEVPLSELLKGYSLESDYRIKTSQVAEQARAAQAQYQQAQALQAHYAQALQTYQQQLQSVRPQPPDPAMIESDPVGYLRQQQAFSTWQGQMQQAQAEQQQLGQMQQMQQAQYLQATLAQQAEMMVKAIPEWADAAKAQAGKAELSSWLEKQGYAPEEVGAIADHRAVAMARKAMLYDQLMAKQADAAKKVANLPPKSPQRPGSGNTNALDGRTRAMQNLKRSGSIDDAAHAFASLMAN